MVTTASPTLQASSGGRGRPGETWVFVTAGSLLTLIALLVGVILLLTLNGLSVFWPHPIARVTQNDGSVLIGQAWRGEAISQDSSDTDAVRMRTLYRIGNRRELGSEFQWVDDDAVKSIEHPPEIVFIERLEWGPALGTIRGVKRAGVPLADLAPDDFDAFDDLVDEARAERIGALAPRVDEAKLITTLELADGRTVDIPLAAIERIVPANAYGPVDRVLSWCASFGRFISENPRESNTEGGILPAILGTFLMVLLMSLAVVPLGVIGALYLNEYAKQGPLVRFVRLAVSNLAGVPSIVFGMFGLAFFVYTIGAHVDATLFSDKLPTPTFGTGGLLWASLTLALLTVPVVIVSTEEGLRAVPRAQREGSLALGSTRWQTIRTIVLPAAMPGILTGTILAIARGAGEVAPLMLTGVVKLAASPLIDATPPFLHLDAKFMHLGFHIYDVGFQSPNVEASRPIVYATALVLLVFIVILNLAAIVWRNRVRRKLQGSTF
ncbi:MAG: phosphate ABC transporter permease PstA [Planctomycetes bacterium]|nr:phosphate ABC transporter permease PstA [Planctomycetota bacterium]MCC7170390.1 phosphate ABC transporter permease PstA [Planctomycetota bacterium]